MVRSDRITVEHGNLQRAQREALIRSTLPRRLCGQELALRLQIRGLVHRQAEHHQLRFGPLRPERYQAAQQPIRGVESPLEPVAERAEINENFYVLRIQLQ